MIKKKSVLEIAGYKV